MPTFDDYSDPGQTVLGYIPPKPEVEPGVWDTVKAGFEMENDMVNAWRMLSAPKFKEQDGFEIGSTLRKYDEDNGTSYFEDHRDRMIGITSDAEFNFNIEKIKREEKFRQTLGASGVTGIIAQIGAGIVSPTIFMPFIGQARGLAAVAQAGAYSFAGAAVQEAVLYTNQTTRTGEEVAWSLAASTALGGILGAAHVALRPAEKQTFASHLEEAAREARGETPPVKVGEEVVPGAKPLEGEPTHIAPRVEEEPVPVVLKGAEDIKAERAAPSPVLTKAQETELREAVFQVAGPDVRLRFQEIIKLAGKSAEAAAQEWGTAAAYASGKWAPEKDLITLSRTHADLSTAYHEAFHRLQDMFMNLQERGVLNNSRKEFENLLAEKHSPEVVAKMSDREVQAEAFAEWMRKGEGAPAPTMVARVWDALKSMLQRTGNLVKGWGFQNADDIFKKAAAGDIAKRTKNVELPEGTPSISAQMAWHGSPHWFDKFMTKFMGTGEGPQAFGWGLYFTQRKGIAEGYRDKLARKIKREVIAVEKATGTIVGDPIMYSLTVGKEMYVANKAWLDTVTGDPKELNNLRNIVEESRWWSSGINDFLKGKIPQNELVDYYDERLKNAIWMVAGKNVNSAHIEKFKAFVLGNVREFANRFDVQITETGGSFHKDGKAVPPVAAVKELDEVLDKLTGDMVKTGGAAADVSSAEWVRANLEEFIKKVVRNTDPRASALIRDEDKFWKEMEHQIIRGLDLVKNTPVADRILDAAQPWLRQVFDYFRSAEWKSLEGRLYKVDIPEDEELLDWSLPLHKQPPRVRAALERLGFRAKSHEEFNGKYTSSTGKVATFEWMPASKMWKVTEEGQMYPQFYINGSDELLEDFPGTAIFPKFETAEFGRDVVRGMAAKHGPKEGSLKLLAEGVRGHRFPAASNGEIDPHAAQNFVIYEDDAINILEYFQQNFRATETPEFQRWFRNSKVVDAEGNPRVMYTGTSKDVDFDKFKAPRNGVWFTPSTEEASMYSMNNDSMGYKADGWKFIETNRASRVIPVYLSLQNPKVLTAWPDEVMAQNYKKAQGILFDKYRAEGYDGVMLLGDDGTVAVAVAFDPKQIKSVYNKGAWAPTDPRISYQIAPEPEDRVGGLARGAQTWAKVTDATKVLTNPVTQSINQKTFGTVRDIARKMADSGLAMEGNMKEHYDDNGNLLYTTHVPTTEQGTIENRIPEYWGMFDQTTRKVNDIYADYIFNGKPPKLLPGTRASLSARKQGKLPFWEFSRAVARTIFNGFETAPNEYVLEAARAVHDNFYKPIFDRAVEVGLLKSDMKLIGDKAYLNRVYNITAINANPQAFIKILQDHFEVRHREAMEKDIKKFLANKKSEEQFLEDAQLSADDYNALLAGLQDAEKSIDETMPEPVRLIEEQLQGLRTAAKAAKKLGNEEEYDRLWAEAKQMEKDNYHLLKDTRDATAGVRRRLKNLTRGVVGAVNEQEKKLTKFEKMVSRNMDGLRRVANMAQRILPKLARMSDKELDAQVSKLRNLFAGAADEYDRLVDRLNASVTDPDIVKSLKLDAAMMKKADRLTELTAKLAVTEGMDRVALRADIEEGLSLVMEKVNEINHMRSVRAGKVAEAADALDPAARAKALMEQQGAMKFTEMDFVRKLEERGAEGVDLSTGTVNVRELALRDATEFKNTVTGTMMHLPVVEVMALERGPELLRMLDIPSTQIEQFLEFDINKLMRMYTRTFAPDIEITRTFGTVNFADIWKPVEEEFDKLSRQLTTVHKDKPELENKKQLALRAEYDQYKLNVRAMYERLRGIRGLPSNPDDLAWRGAKLVMDLNVTRQMGMVLSASLPDVARPVMRYGLTRTMKDAIIPMITNFKQFKLSALEAAYAGAAVDTTAHLRSTGFHDTMDDLMRGTKFERAVSYLSTHMGVVALFDIWTDKMKLVTGAVANGKIMESLATVHGVEGYMNMADAMHFLTQNSISGSTAAAMWKEIMENGGGQKINGVWWPNTKSWKNPEAVRMYRQMLAREVNNTIVTPGIDKPLMADANMLGRMLYQFKSFGMASNSRVVMSGLQQQDAAVLNGALLSMAMGAVSYAMWATATGGKAYEDMVNADFEKWLDEMIQRSGLFGALGEVQRVGQTIPAISPFMSFSNTKSTRRPGDNLVESLLGPSFGFLQEAGNVIGGLHDPTQATAHALRKMMPFQQTMIIREVWDAFEAGLGHFLPERRTP